MKVLAVDDDKVNCAVVDAILAKLKLRHNIDYDIVMDGIESLRLCTTNKYDLIFMDIMMPGMSGIEAIKAIRSIYDHRSWNLPTCVMVTACGRNETYNMVKSLGTVGYIMKPVSELAISDWIYLVETNKDIASGPCETMKSE